MTVLTVSHLSRSLALIAFALFKPIFGVIVTFSLQYAKNILFSLDYLHQTLLMPCR